MNKEPFDLVRAIKGEPVVDTDGEKANFFKLLPDMQYPVLMEIGGSIAKFALDGRVCSKAMGGMPRLFMAAPEQPAEPEPFDLARAQAGEEIMLDNDEGAELLDYDLRRHSSQHVLIKTESGRIIFLYEHGISSACSEQPQVQLVMKPATPKTKVMQLWSRRYLLGHDAREDYRSCVEGESVSWRKEIIYDKPAYLNFTWEEPIGDNDAS